MKNCPVNSSYSILLALAGLLLVNELAIGQTFSIDFQGPTSVPGPGPVSDGGILTPTGFGFPATVVPPVFGPGSLGLFPPGVGAAGNYEVDALSYGTEPMLVFDPFLFRQSWTFSVDEFAIGLPNPPFSVFTEGAFGATEASADVYRSNVATPGYPLAIPPIPGPPIPLPVGFNTQAFDGNGTTAPTLDLLEPNPPTSLPLVGVVASFPDPGDNLDAWDIDAPVGSVPIYFSLDSAFPDPFEPPGIVNSGTAPAQGFNGGDVLVSALGGGFGLYADARLLGLNEGIPLPVPNPIDVDDLDALVLWENGTGVYEPTTGPYSWMFGGSDMLLFSVRRNSAILVGPAGGPVFDALGSGLMITEADILVPVFDPIDGIFVQDAVEGDWDIGIFVNAEALGLSTVRFGGGAPWTAGMPNPRYGFDIWDDELDALDIQQIFLIADSDGDRDVDGRDFFAWQRGIGLTGPFVTPADGDFNLDYTVDGLDLALWQFQYGSSFPLTAAVTVPEPATFALLSCSLLVLLRCRIRASSREG